MKRHTLVAVALWALIGLTAVSAYGQDRVKIDVPFDFVVADRTFAQGEYLITSFREKVFVQNSEGKIVAMVLSSPVSGRSVGTTGLAVFQCYEQRCFLSEMWNPTQVAGRQLLKSRWEKEVAKRKTATYFALAAKGKN